MSLSRTLSEQVHVIFIIKLLSSETNEAMRENKGNFFFSEKKIESSFMLQWRRYPFINRINTTPVWSAPGRVASDVLCDVD